MRTRGGHFRARRPFVLTHSPRVSPFLSLPSITHTSLLTPLIPVESLARPPLARPGRPRRYQLLVSLSRGAQGPAQYAREMRAFTVGWKDLTHQTKHWTTWRVWTGDEAQETRPSGEGRTTSGRARRQPRAARVFTSSSASSPGFGGGRERRRRDMGQEAGARRDLTLGEPRLPLSGDRLGSLYRVCVVLLKPSCVRGRPRSVVASMRCA